MDFASTYRVNGQLQYNTIQVSKYSCDHITPPPFRFNTGPLDRSTGTPYIPEAAERKKREEPATFHAVRKMDNSNRNV